MRKFLNIMKSIEANRRQKQNCVLYLILTLENTYFFLKTKNIYIPQIPINKRKDK